MPRTYVDNAYNRSAGRVGMAHGTAVISSASSGRSSSSYSGGGGGGGGRTYVDNSSNRALGRVGLPLGSAVQSSSGSSNSHSAGNGSRAYVDNAQNRSLGRVGLPVGSAVHSTSNPNSASHGSTKTTYVDNEMNRSLGRVGLSLGSAVHSKSAGENHSSLSSSAATRSVGAACYVDNAYNRRLGRVGLAYGTAVMSTSNSSSGNLNGNTKCYVDNPMNRKLGRVGNPLGSAPVQNSKSVRCHSPLDDVFKPLIRIDPEDTDLGDLLRQIRRLRDDLRKNDEEADSFRERNCDAAEGIVYRHEAALTKHRAGLQTPEWVRGGEVIDFKDIELGEKLGSGGFGDVFVGIWKNNFQIAIKKLRVQRVSQRRKDQFQEEVKVFSSLSHPCIVKFFGVCVTPPNLAIVMEFMAGGSLHDVLHVEMRDLSSNQKYQMVTDSLSALKYMHGKDIAHRDIKSMNILVCDDYTHCKLGDFGLALKEESRSSASVVDHAAVGTLVYSPPEVIRGDRLNIEGLKSADIYSMTIVIIELLTGRKPYDGLNQHQVRAAIMNKERPSITSLTDMNEEAKELLRRGMSSTRPSASTMYSSWNLLALGNQLGRLTLAESSHNVVRTDPNVMSSLPPLSRGVSYSSQLRSLDRPSWNGVVDDLDGSIAASSSTSSSGRRSCPVCMNKGVEYVFQCGHATCEPCFLTLHTNDSTCPKCRGSIASAIKLFL